MTNVKLSFKFPSSLHFDDLNEVLCAQPGIVGVAKLSDTQGFVEFDTENSADAAVAYIAKEIPGVQFEDSTATKEKGTVGGGEKPKTEPKKKSANLAEEFFDFSSAPSTQPIQQWNPAQQRAQRGRGRGRGGRGGGYRGRGGGRGRGGRGGRGTGMQMPPSMPFPFSFPIMQPLPQPVFVEGHVASIYGVAPRVTNSHIAEAFADCGSIFDIARYENLALLYFDSADSVMKAIYNFNGKSFHGGVITVSDGGVLKVPMPYNPNPASMSPF